MVQRRRWHRTPTKLRGRNNRNGWLPVARIPGELLGRNPVRLVVVNPVFFLLVPDVAVSGGEDEAPQKNEVTHLPLADVIDDSLDQRRWVLAHLRLGALLVREE